MRTDSSDLMSLLLVDSNRYNTEIESFNAMAVEQKVTVRSPRIICPEVEGETNASSPTETSPNATRVETGFFDEEYVNGQRDSALSPQYATKVAASAVKAVPPLLESDPGVTRRPPRPSTPGSLPESPPDHTVRFPRIICPFFSLGA